MTTEWAHLPNAAHIDRVIATMEAMPLQYVMNWSAYHAAYHAVQEQRRNAIWEAVRSEAWGKTLETVRYGRGWNTAYDTAYDAARDATWQAARDAILALIAFDDCAYMLDSDPGELAILAKFGDPRAALLFPTCKVFHSIKDIV